ncbi:hypothetical protein SeLEV6574_g08372, partial [Synchytrium endobioticum]
MSWIYPLKTKNEAFNCFKVYRALVENQAERTVKILRTDRSAPYTPMQNGVAEKLNRVIMDMTKALLKHSGLPEGLWVEAVITASYLRNRVPSASLDGKIPIPYYK